MNKMLQLSKAAMASFWPAYMVLDSQGLVLDCGPSLQSRFEDCLRGKLAKDILGSAWEQILKEGVSARDIFYVRPKNFPPLRGVAIPAADKGNVLLMTFDVSSLREAIALGVTAQDLCIPMGQHQQLVNITLRDALLGDLKRSTEEIMLTREMLEKNIQFKSQLTSYLCHDFTNLLSVIAFDATRITKSTSKREREKIAKNINTAATLGAHASRTLTQLNLPKLAKRFCVDQWLSENINFLRSGTRELELRTEFSAPGKFIDADQNELLFCILNLLINAREATTNEAYVTIATDCETHFDALKIRISITDHGAGISHGVGSSPRSTKANDRGLGLSAVRAFCTRYQGEFAIQSTPGFKTVASILLPLITH